MTTQDVLARVEHLKHSLDSGDLAAVGQGLGALASDLRAQTRGHRCPDCGLRFRWPGELEEHLRLRHYELWEAA